MNSADYAKQASIPWDDWVRRVREGRYVDVRKTAWYKAGKALEAETHPPKPTPVPPPVPSPPPAAHGNLCVYMSTVNQDTVNWLATLGPRYTVLFSADLNLSGPAGPYYVTDAQLRMLKAAGVTCASWCDSSATPYGHAVKMAETRGLAFAGGQAEDTEQWRQTIGGGAQHIIGNPANLDAIALGVACDLTARGRLAFIGEVLHPDPGYSAQGVTISSACFYVDMDEAHGGYQPLSSFSVMPAGMRQGCSLYTGAKLSAEDRRLYEEWTRP